MAKQGRSTPDWQVWTEKELKSLLEALDQIHEKGLYENLKHAKQYIRDRELLCKFDDSEIQHKLVGIAKIVNTTPAPLVKDWARHKEAVVEELCVMTSSGSSSESESQSKNSKRKSKGPPTRKTKRQRQKRHRDSQSATSKAAGQLDAAEAAAEAAAESAPAAPVQTKTREPRPGRKLGPYDPRDYPGLQAEFLRHWNYSTFNRKYETQIYRMDPLDDFHNIMELIYQGVQSFRKAQPFTHLTTASLTDESLGLARSFLATREKNHAERTLRCLFGDPLNTPEVVLRSFAAAAVFCWALGGSYGTLPEKRPAHAQRSLNGKLREFCEKNLPQLCEALEQEDHLCYLEEVVQPTLPALARQFRVNLFEVFTSLRKPPAPPEPWQYSVTDPDKPHGSSIEYREWHQGNFDMTMEQAFLAALNFRLLCSRVDPSKQQFSYYLPWQGQDFDMESMTVATSDIADNKVTKDNKVSLCLCPEIRATFRVGKPEDGMRWSSILRAVVMIEGYEITEFEHGYPLHKEAKLREKHLLMLPGSDESQGSSDAGVLEEENTHSDTPSNSSSNAASPSGPDSPPPESRP